MVEDRCHRYRCSLIRDRGRYLVSVVVEVKAPVKRLLIAVVGGAVRRRGVASIRQGPVVDWFH